jgi:hypothetical protein
MVQEPLVFASLGPNPEIDHLRCLPTRLCLLRGGATLASTPTDSLMCSSTVWKNVGYRALVSRPVLERAVLCPRTVMIIFGAAPLVLQRLRLTATHTTAGAMSRYCY